MASGSLCDPCQTQGKYVTGVRWCPDCEETLCDHCVSYHKSSKATKSHHLVDVNLVSDLPLEISKQQYCVKHNKLLVEYFCVDHDDICCRACLAEEHKSCGKAMALDMACQYAKKSILEDSDKEVENILYTLGSFDTEIKSNMSKVNAEIQEVEREMAKAKAKAIDRLNENEKNLISGLQTKKRQIMTKLQDIKRKAQSITENASSTSKQIQFVKEHGTDKQAFLLAHNLKSFLKETDNSLSDIMSNVKITTVKFDENTNMASTMPTLGRIADSEKSLSVKYIPLKQKYAQCIVPQASRPLTSFLIISQFDLKSSGCLNRNILGMIATEDGHLLLCNYTKENGVLVFNQNGQYKQTINLEHMPYDTAEIPGSNQYVVTLPEIRSIQYIGKDNLKPGKSVKIPAGDNTYGIAATNQSIYVGEFRQIHVLNLKGDLMKKIIMGKRVYFMYYLVINADNLYASDQYRTIFCFDQNGTLTNQSNTSTNLGVMRKLAIDTQGCLYIGGEGSGRVHRFTKDLKPDITIGDDSIQKIGAICFNKDCSKLFVAVERGKTIVVYGCT